MSNDKDRVSALESRSLAFLPHARTEFTADSEVTQPMPVALSWRFGDEGFVGLIALLVIALIFDRRLNTTTTTNT